MKDFRGVLAALYRRLLRRGVFRSLVGVRAYRLVGISDSGANSSALVPAAEGICSIPEYSGGSGAGVSLRRKFPALHVWEIPDAQLALNHRFSAVLQRERIYIQDRQEPPPFQAYKAGTGAYRTANIVGQEQDHLFVKNFRTHRHVDEAVYVGTRATYNWSHLLINFLPGIYLANHYSKLPKRIPVVVPHALLGRPDYLEVLEIVLEGREIVTILESELLEVDRLFWVDAPAYDGPFAENSGERQPLVWHKEAMEDYRQFLVSQLDSGAASEPASRSRRISIDRPAGGQRPVTVENLESVLREFGFESVQTETLSLGEKRELMSGVSHVVAPAGSGLANVIFANPGIRVLAFSLLQAPSFDNFVPNLVELVGGRLDIFSLRNEVRVDNATAYDVPEGLFRDQLASFLARD